VAAHYDADHGLAVSGMSDDPRVHDGCLRAPVGAERHHRRQPALLGDDRAGATQLDGERVTRLGQHLEAELTVQVPREGDLFRAVRPHEMQQRLSARHPEDAKTETGEVANRQGVAARFAPAVRADQRVEAVAVEKRES
jgi:hypothetical protein